MEISGRSQVEVLKFLEAAMVAKVAPLVSKAWGQAGKSRDLWWVLLGQLEGMDVFMEGGQDEGGWESAKKRSQYRKSVFAFNCDRSFDGILQKNPGGRGKVHPPMDTTLEIVSLPSITPTLFSLPASYAHALNSTYLYLPVSKLFIAGGRLTSLLDVCETSPTYLLSLPDKVASLESRPRVDFPLLVRQRDVIYAFGSGSCLRNSITIPDEHCSDKWKFSLKDWRWSQIEGDRLSNHYRGWAELYKEKIYIIGGLGSFDMVDVFDTITETVSVIPVQIPFESCIVIGFRQEDVLYMTTENHLCPINLPQLAAGVFEPRDSISIQFEAKWYRSSPVFP